MKEVLLEEKSILDMKSKVIIATLVLTVIVGLGTAVQAVPDIAPNETAWLLYRQTALFNPFTLSTGMNVAQSTSPPDTDSRSGNVPDLPEEANWRAHIRVPVRGRPRSPWQPGNPWE